MSSFSPGYIAQMEANYLEKLREKLIERGLDPDHVRSLSREDLLNPFTRNPIVSRPVDAEYASQLLDRTIRFLASTQTLPNDEGLDLAAALSSLASSLRRSSLSLPENQATQDATMTGDCEADHATADRLLCELLLAIGCSKSVEAREKVGKWYA